MDPVGFTARMTAAARARETERPDRLFEDAFAAELAGREGFEFLDRHDAAVGQPRATFAVRTRFFDDHLLAAARDLGVRQVILLAAGLDTRAFRLEWPLGVQIYELDQPEVLAYKATVLASFKATPSCSRHVTAVDLRTDWPRALLAAGYRARGPSI
jgi:methyltransferase (TIGR00027 family)